MKRIGKYCTAFISLSLVIFYASAQEKLSLETIIKKVEAEYPLVLQYESRIRSLQSKVDGSSSWMPPTFSFGMNSFPYQLQMIERKNDPMNWASLMFSVEQMIPNSSKLRAKSTYYNSLKEVQVDNAEWTKNILRNEVKRLYYQRYVAERKLELLTENKELLNLIIKISESRYTYNQADLSTIFKAKAKLQELSNMEIMSKSEVSESNIGINTLLNRDTNTPFAIDTLVSMLNYDSLNAQQDASTIQRSDIKSMTQNIQSMELNKKWMATGSKPDFGIKVAHMNMYGMPNQFTIMGMITIPIAPWSSKMYKSEVKSMTYDIQAMNKVRENMQLMATRMINEKLSMLKYEKEQYSNFEKNIIPSYKKNFDANLLAYKQNTGNFFVLLDAWEMLLMKRFEQLAKLKDVLKLQTEYEFEREIK